MGPINYTPAEEAPNFYDSITPENSRTNDYYIREYLKTHYPNGSRRNLVSR